MELWQECRAAIDTQRRRYHDDEARKRLEKPIPQPKQFPATLDDFYRLIVRAKNKTESQPRFKRYLLWVLNYKRLNVEFDPRFAERPKPALMEGTKEAIDAVESELRRYQNDGILHKIFWDSLAEHYRRWWEPQRLETNRVNARKHKPTKITPEKAVGKLADALQRDAEKEKRGKNSPHS